MFFKRDLKLGKNFEFYVGHCPKLPCCKTATAKGYRDFFV